MGDVVNLKRARKRAERDKAAETAEVNRVKFGRTKAEKKRDSTNASQASEHLDAHRLEPSASGKESET